MFTSFRKRTVVRHSARLSRSAQAVRALGFSSLLFGGALTASQAQSAGNGAVDLEPVLVTASRSAQPLATAPIGATIITALDIQRSGVSDANEAIRKLAGVVGRTDLNGGREQTLDLRGYGSTADNNLVVLVDGVRISESEISAARLSAIPVQLIDRIEIVRGGNSVLWGEGASAGAINVILKAPLSGKPTASVSAAAGSFNARDLRASGSTNLGQISLDAAVQHLETDGYRANNAYRQDAANAGVHLKEGRFKVSVRFQTESQGARMPGSLTFAQFEADPRQTVHPDDHASTTQNRYSLATEYGWSGWGDWLLQADAAQRQKAAHYALHSGSGVYYGDTSSDAVQFTPRLTHRAAWSGWGETTTLGFDEVTWDYLNTSSYQNEVGRQTNRAVYVHSDWTAPTATRLTLGARKERVAKQAQDSTAYQPEDYDNAYHVSASEWGLNQTLPGGWDVYGRWALSYRLPNVDELRATATVPSELRAQRNRDVEAGAKWQQGGHRAALRVFRQHTVDEIGYDPTAGLYGANTNLDPTQRQGVELEGSTLLTSAIKLSGTWQALTARFRSGSQAGREVPLVAPRSGTARVSYTLNEHHEIDLGVQYRAAMRFGNDNANTCTERIPSATLLDARYVWTQGGWEVALAASNLTDRQTYSYAYSCATGSLYPDNGRAVKLTATWRY